MKGVSKNVISFRNVDFSGLKIPMIVVYERPRDFPDKYIARVFNCEIPTDVIIVRDSLQEIRDDITAAGFMVCLERSQEDVLSVVETWMK